jgi:hypothetical protein
MFCELSVLQLIRLDDSHLSHRASRYLNTRTAGCPWFNCYSLGVICRVSSVGCVLCRVCPLSGVSSVGCVYETAWVSSI